MFPLGVEILEDDGASLRLRLRYTVPPFAWSIWGFGVVGVWCRGVVAGLALVTPWGTLGLGDLAGLRVTEEVL